MFRAHRGDWRPTCRAQDRDHLLFGASTPLQTRLFRKKPSSQVGMSRFTRSWSLRPSDDDRAPSYLTTTSGCYGDYSAQALSHHAVFAPDDVVLTHSLRHTLTAIACDNHNDLRHLTFADLFFYFVQDEIISFFKQQAAHLYSIL